MTIRVYLMPRTGSGNTRQDPKIAKYGHLMANWMGIYYGPEPYCLVIADVDAATHAAVSANSDVRALPADLNSTLTNGTRTAIQSALEAANIPGQWVTNGMTFRSFVRRLAGIFFLMQRVHGKKMRFLQASLNDPISALPANVPQAMQEAAAEFQISMAGITTASTLRAALETIGSQFATRPLIFKGVSL